MLYCVVFEYCEYSGDTDAVVGAEGGAVGGEPFAVKQGLYGVGHEVEFFVGVFLAYHVDVGLQADDGAVLVAFGGVFSDEDVAEGVAFCVEGVGAAPVYQPGGDAFLVLGGARNLHNFPKPVPDTRGLESFQWVLFHGVCVNVLMC